MAKSDNGELNNSNFGSNSSDPNNSLLKKVTKRVSGLFPSSLTKWFGPSEEHQSVIRRRESTDDEDDQLQMQQPPKKRAKSRADVDYSTPNSFQMTSTPLINSRGDMHYLQPGASGFTRNSTVTSGHYDADSASSSRRHLLSEATTSYSRTRTEAVVNGDDKSDSGDSTSGYSSVLAQQHKESSFVSDRGNALNPPSTSKLSPTPSPNKSLNASLNSSRSLFSDQSLNPQRQCLSARRPSFNVSTFGSASFVDRTLSTKRATNSPFYGGRTTYGGASAYRRNRIIFPRDKANNVQVKDSVCMKPVNDTPTNENVSLSKTARRILDALEHFSTPLVDAKKIPNINRQNNLNKTTRMTPYSRESTSKPDVPNRELIIPNVSDLLKMKLKERLQDSTVQVRKVATTSKSVLNSEYKIRTIEDESTKPQKHTSKIKAKISTTRDKKDKLHDTVDAVKLPEVKLPITNLPKFDFSLTPPPPVVKPAETFITPAITKSNTEILKFAKTNSNFQQYTFAKPVTVTNSYKSIISINNFKFSEPIDAKSNITNKKSTIINIPTPEFTFKSSDSSTAPRRKEPTKNNGQNDFGFSLQSPKELTQGSVMDVLRKSENKPQSDNLMDKFKPPVGTWECAACMVRNISTATRCVACTTIKEQSKKLLQPSTEFGSHFKMSSDKWECSACMVRNSKSDTKCVACTTPKQVSKSSAAQITPAVPVSKSFDGFGEKFKPASGTWECSACMVRNKSDVTKCVACKTAKPGLKTETKSTLVMLVHETKSHSGFTDLIKTQQSNWECPSCMVRNPQETKRCVCCEGPKPGEKQEFNFKPKASTTQFKFGIDKGSSNISTGTVPGFMFGTTNATPVTFSFGIKSVSTSTDSKPTASAIDLKVVPALTDLKSASTMTDSKTALTSTDSKTALTSTDSKAGLTTTDSKPVPSEYTFGIPAAVNKPEVPQKPTAIVSSTPVKFSFGVPVASESTKTIIPTTTASELSLPTFMFASTTNSAQNTPPAKPIFSFGTAIPSSSSAASTSNKIVSSSIFGSNTPTTTITNLATPKESPAVSSTPVTAAVSTSALPVVTTNSFSFKSTTSKPIAFNSENKTNTLPMPQFNFGSSGLPFNPNFPNNSGIAAATTTPSLNFGSPSTFTSASTVQNKTEATPAAAFSSSQTPFTFKPNTTPTNNNNKTDVKTFAFGGTATETTPANFSFAPKQEQTSAPLSKAPLFNFAQSPAPEAQKQTNNLFAFGANKTENKTTAFGNSSMFGQSQPASTPQNGTFNFGATAVAPNFNFGAAAATTAPTMFGFGSSQAGSGSAAVTAPVASATGIFTFGGGAPAQQQNTSAFTPDIKPNFNFTGGSTLPTFTAQGGASAAAMPQRKIRRAVRRTQPR